MFLTITRQAQIVQVRIPSTPSTLIHNLIDSSNFEENEPLEFNKKEAEVVGGNLFYERIDKTSS